MDPLKKKIHIIGGGTFSPVRPHFALAAPAFGTAARTLARKYEAAQASMDVVCHLTKMADYRSSLVTNSDVEELVDRLIEDPATKIIVFSVAMCDFDGAIPSAGGESANSRLDSSVSRTMNLHPSRKVISKIRASRKDIFLIGFKTTALASEQEQFSRGLRLMKESSCNLVLANDIVTRVNMIITPEETSYHTTTDRNEVLDNLVDMSLLRSHLTFTRSTVIAGEPVPWSSPVVPDNLRTIVDHLIRQDAYKPGPTGATVGHFAAKIGPTTFLTSRRKQNFNEMAKVGLVKIETDGPDTVLAYGSKPSVGGQSQRIIFEEHPEADCIVHAHVPLRADHPDPIPVVSQREYECGSHQCGENTSRGLASFPDGGGDGIKAVMLDKHGPNIVFHHSVNPAEVVAFIERNFDLSKKT